MKRKFTSQKSEASIALLRQLVEQLEAERPNYDENTWHAFMRGLLYGARGFDAMGLRGNFAFSQYREIKELTARLDKVCAPIIIRPRFSEHKTT